MKQGTVGMIILGVAFTLTVLAGAGVMFLVLAGCTRVESEKATKSSPPGVALGTYFLSAKPEGSVSLAEARKTAKPGDRVVFEACVGGSAKPFVDGRAVMLVADTSIPSCRTEEGDCCETPWDYCCEPPEVLRANTATVQLIDEKGQPLKKTLRGVHGLEGLKVVQIVGTVAQIPDGGSFVVNATGIHVPPG